jgi:8-oxo-dGTP pyrophosphatase MutT (NUDIX family)
MKVNRDFFMARLAQSPGERPLGNLRPAAVLVPIVDRAEPTVLFTLRTDHLPTHAGQVCFPGGRVHDDDETPVATALRETHEEIGVAHDHIEVLGFLEPYNTGTGYSVIPVVGFVHPDHTLAPNIDEVAEVFEVPLDFLLDIKNCAWTQRARANGDMMDTCEIVFGRHAIWGATAQILMNLTGKLRA